MGLLDVLNGMQNGPRGRREPNQAGGMSPITMAILGLLAYKALKHFTGGRQAPQSGGSPPRPDGTRASLPGGLSGSLGDLLGGRGGGGLADLLKGGLGGALAGGAAGSILSGGLGDLLGDLKKNGLGPEADSWVSQGPNQSVSPDELGKALGADELNTLSQQTGLSRDDLLSSLAQYLPDAVNHLTPEGRLPSEQEADGML